MTRDSGYHRRTRRMAFTLMELLVVTAVILIMLAASLAGLTRARQVAYRIACINNLRQTQQSMFQFTMDNQGVLPNYCYNAPLPANDGQFSITVNPNWTLQNVGPTATKGILVCPADKKPWTVNGIAASYAYNFLPLLMNWRVLNLHPASTVLIFDGNPSAATTSLWWGQGGAVGSNGKMTICHKPGTPAEKTMQIPPSALGGHLGHGDYVGPCGGGASINDTQFAQSVGNTNTMLLVRRHFNQANLSYLDGHVDTLTAIPSSGLQ